MTGRAGPPCRALRWFREAGVTRGASCTNRRQAARRQSRGRTQRRGVHASGCAIGSVATRTASGFPLPVESPDGSTQLNRHHWGAVSRCSFRQGSEPRRRGSGARPRRRRRDEARRRAVGARLLERVEQATGCPAPARRRHLQSAVHAGKERRHCQPHGRHDHDPCCECRRSAIPSVVKDGLNRERSGSGSRRSAC